MAWSYTTITFKNQYTYTLRQTHSKSKSSKKQAGSEHIAQTKLKAMHQTSYIPSDPRTNIHSINMTVQIARKFIYFFSLLLPGITASLSQNCGYSKQLRHVLIHICAFTQSDVHSLHMHASRLAHKRCCDHLRIGPNDIRHYKADEQGQRHL